MRRELVVLLPFLLFGCADSHQPLARIDPTKAFQIEFGRGSGWHGLDTIAVESSGAVTLFRRGADAWETGTLSLPSKAVDDVVAAVEGNALLRLNRVYQDPRVADGRQWVFRARQGRAET